MSAHIEYLLRLADNGLILSHRLAEWAGHGPVLEEDIALSNIGLDLLGQARLLYQHAGTLAAPESGAPRTEDDFAYFRDASEFRNFTMLELPNSGVASGGPGAGDYGFTIVRNALYSSWGCLAWLQLQSSADAQLAAIAGKAVKETRYHWRHASDWLVRLGDGTAESHGRMQRALDSLLPYCNEWFVGDQIDQQMHAMGVGFEPANLREPWLAMLKPVIAESTLSWSKDSHFQSKGKAGQHGEHLSYLLAHMQALPRLHPGAVW